MKLLKSYDRLKLSYFTIYVYYFTIDVAKRIAVSIGTIFCTPIYTQQKVKYAWY